jgi:hypothetical protein
MLASCPISIEEKSSKKVGDKVIGVLNVESNAQNAVDLITDLTRQVGFYKKMVYLANIYSKLHI